MFGVRLVVPQKPAGKFAFKNSLAISTVSAVVPSSRPAPRAAPSTAPASLACTMYSLLPSIARPTSGSSNVGSMVVNSTMADPRRRPPRWKLARMVSPLESSEQPIGIRRMRSYKRRHAECCRRGLGDIKHLAGRQAGYNPVHAGIWVYGAECGHRARFGYIIRNRDLSRGRVDRYGRRAAGQRTADIARADAGIADLQPLRKDPLALVRASTRVAV